MKIIRYLVWMTISIAVVIILFACATIPLQQDIPRSVVEWSEANVWKVLVQDEGATGSSFLISENTWLTACHVVKDKKVAYVQAADRKHTVFVKVTKCSEIYDMALLEYVGDEPLDIDMRPTVFAELGVEDRGKIVYGPGYPQGFPLMVTSGHWQSEIDLGNFVSTPISKGDSGSPAVAVVDGKIAVVGIRLWLVGAISHMGIVSVTKSIAAFLKKPR